MFDWDGTAVPDRSANASAVRAAVESACALGLDVAVVSGTHVGNIDPQLGARPAGPGELHLLLNRGSEAFGVSVSGPRLLERRVASEEEDAALDRAAARTAELLADRGLESRVVSQRLNRRKIDLIPELEWTDPPKARIAQLLTAVEARLRGHGIDGLAGAVALAELAARESGLAAPRVTSDAKHVEIGLTDKSDSAHWWMAHEWLRGVWPEQVLIVGDELGPLGGLPGSDSLLLTGCTDGASVASVGVEPEGLPAGVTRLGGGPERFLELLERQLRLRREGALPIVASDARWTVRVEGADEQRERARESLLALADGRLGTRGSVLAPAHASRPGVVLAGVYSGTGESSELLSAPLWNRICCSALGGSSLVRTLDLRTGVLTHEASGGEQALQFSSLAAPALAVLRALGPREELEASPPLVADPHAGAQHAAQASGGGAQACAAISEDGLEAVALQSVNGAGERAALTRIAAFAPSCADPGASSAQDALEWARAGGAERLLIEHRSAWARRWEQADVRIEGDAGMQQAVRLALYHLIGSAADGGEAAVGARGLTGPGYRGHVFWDSDVFVLPFLAATHPRAARAIVEYRVRRLPAARASARAQGRRGARFAWESAADGFDVTPHHALDAAGREIAIRTGEEEEHIVADVAWGAACYADWSGDRAFASGAGLRLLVETARYWASRAERGAHGRAHIRGVIGPDEYHEAVDDNAYTNVMARWNLRRAAAAVADAGGGRGVGEAEREGWLELAGALVDGYRPDSGIYEQFAGFFGLEPLLISEIAPRRPVAADALLGQERVRAAQVVKQADVLMLHHLVPAEVHAGSLEPNIDFYEPRTAHGSSLSSGIHASVLARAGRLEQAVEMLRMAARTDLDDISQTSAAGVHMAAMGSVWQALAYGFLGLRPDGELLQLDPRLPAGWEALELRVRFRGAALRVRVTHETVELVSDRLLEVRIGAAGPGSETVFVGEFGHVARRAAPD